MTVMAIKDLLTGIDPDAQRYDHSEKGADAYTVWRELEPVGLYADGREQGSIRFQVDRFTREEDDETAEDLLEMLEAQEDIAVEYRTDYEKDTGYIHHIYVCEAI